MLRPAEKVDGLRRAGSTASIWEALTECTRGRGEEFVAIEAGAPAPALSLTLEDAEGEPHDVGEELSGQPAVLGIYKSSCQASKTMFPFLERVRERYADADLVVLGVSQDSANITRSFARRLGLTFPILIEGDQHPVSRAFEIQATPTVFVLGADGTVAYTTMGFFKQQVEEIGEAVAATTGREVRPLLGEADVSAPMFVPG